MSKHGRGVLMFDAKEPHIHGYLVIGKRHYQVTGKRMSDIRVELDIRRTSDDDDQVDMFDDRKENSQAPA
jgi:hypothetical protein